MSTKESLELKEITSGNPLLSSIRSIVETAFYGNNVQEVFDRKTAYQLAKGSPGTIITDLTISHAEELDLPADVRTLVFNDGSIVGRTASARRIFEDLDKEQSKYEKILREAVYQSRKRQFYHTKVIVGLSEEFSVQSHLLIPEGFENNLYSYMLNFQPANAKILRLIKSLFPLTREIFISFVIPNGRMKHFQMDSFCLMLSIIQLLC